MNSEKDIRLAVLIDADNIPYHSVKDILEEIAKYGTPTFNAGKKCNRLCNDH